MPLVGLDHSKPVDKGNGVLWKKGKEESINSLGGRQQQCVVRLDGLVATAEVLVRPAGPISLLRW